MPIAPIVPARRRARVRGGGGRAGGPAGQRRTNFRHGPAGWTADYALDINDAWQVLAVLCHDVAGVRSCRTGRLEPPPGTGDYKIPPFIRRLGEGWAP
ncbi:hypothetical protein [uncultured Massilia sp.]|uniref:hypothetical protein n=1 Tax=uncultured Massilia sp. TaxID=169973 RepID=UPI0025DE2D5A|nr:hypothetical protein [uncultured Massilia sp.]